jgi:hypothetical protein
VNLLEIKGSYCVDDDEENHLQLTKQEHIFVLEVSKLKASISEFEEQLISEYIHLDFLIEILESDLNTLKQVPLKIKEPYLLIIEATLKKVRTELRIVKAKMRELKIKVFSKRRLDDMFIEYQYTAHGYHGSNKYWDAALLFASSKRLKKYLGQGVE